MPLLTIARRTVVVHNYGALTLLSDPPSPLVLLAKAVGSTCLTMTILPCNKTFVSYLVRYQGLLYGLWELQNLILR